MLEKPCVHSIFIRMLIMIMYWSNSKLGHVWLKSRSLGQILEKPCVHSRGHSFDSTFINFYQNIYDHNI